MPEEEDQQLFRDAMGDAEPLEDERVTPFKPKRRPVPIEQPEGETPETEFADTSIQTYDELHFMRPGIQHRLMQDLQRGRLVPEETLDLHGYHVEEARRLVRDFLSHASQRGYRCIRIIHGKGKGSDGQQPVLKQKVNQWLPQSERVLAFCTAPRWDGGLGAAYVLLRRERQDGTEL